MAFSLKSFLGKTIGTKGRGNDAEFWKMYGGNHSNSGQSVTERSVLQLSTAQACIRLVSESAGVMPVNLYQKTSDGHDELLEDHPISDLLSYMPNSEMGANDFWEICFANLCIDGNFYAEKKYLNGKLTSLIPLHHSECEPFRDQSANNKLRYRIEDRYGNRRVLESDSVFHVRGFSAGQGDCGLSPIAYGVQAFGNAQAADEASGKMFANGIRPTGVIESDTILKPEQREDFKNNIVKPLVGAKNTGGVFVLEAGFSYRPISLNPDDAQLLETRRFNVEEICRWYKVQPYLIGHPDGSSGLGSGFREKDLAFLKYTLTPYTNRICWAIRTQLLSRADAKKIKAKFDPSNLLQLDMKTKSEILEKQTGSPIKTINEARAEINLPPVKGGEKVRTQMQNIPVDKEVQNVQ